VGRRERRLAQSRATDWRRSQFLRTSVALCFLRRSATLPPPSSLPIVLLTVVTAAFPVCAVVAALMCAAGPPPSILQHHCSDEPFGDILGSGSRTDRGWDGRADV
jgi:hypothetical protein